MTKNKDKITTNRKFLIINGHYTVHTNTGYKVIEKIILSSCHERKKNTFVFLVLVAGTKMMQENPEN